MNASGTVVFQYLKGCYIMNKASDVPRLASQTALWIWFQSRLRFLQLSWRLHKHYVSHIYCFKSNSSCRIPTGTVPSGWRSWDAYFLTIELCELLKKKTLNYSNACTWFNIFSFTSSLPTDIYLICMQSGRYEGLFKIMYKWYVNVVKYNVNSGHRL